VLYRIMEKWGYSKDYLQKWLKNHEHTYGTTGMLLINERYKNEKA
jgi:hypothetical protein